MKFIVHKALVVVVAAAAAAQNQSPKPQPQAISQTDPVQIIGFVSKTVSWYHQQGVEQQLATEPADFAFLQENRRLGDQVVQQAFDYARQQADARSRHSTSPSSASTSDSQHYQGLAQAEQKTQQQVQDTQAELQSTRDKLAHARPSQRQSLQAQVGELESEVGLLQARADALQTMLEFVSASNSGTNEAGLRAQIEELSRSVPASLTKPAGASGKDTEASAPPNSNARNVEQTGIWGLTATAIHLAGKAHSLDDQIHATGDLGNDTNALRQPLLDHMRDLIRQGDALFAAADTATPAQLGEQKEQLDALTGQFKQTASAMLPLSKIGVLLDAYQRNLTNWRESVNDGLHDDLRQLLFRVIVLVALIAIVFGVGEIWRRTTFRYVHDTRRRYQFLLLRRIVIWVTIAIIVILTFASQLGSAVTFAGLITAGVAVALQNVILSVVAYFFLIGKYGIRVGDRVQIAGVTGEVVEIGLVRIHLMELQGPGNSQPTGRTVAFSNSIVFQPTSGVFKQIPGTNFVWHELKLTLAPDADYHAARERITQAAEAALEGFRDTMEAQRASLARNLVSVSPAELRARVRLHYTGAGIEATVSFPVEFQKSSEMDDRMMKEIMAALGREPKIRLLGAEAPLARAGD